MKARGVVMSLVKKNVLQGFIQDDYLPDVNQQIVKYVAGRGNNLHEVECHDGTTFLVSMPQKYRQMVWLRKGNCIVIDPIVEGKKVRGEIICIVPPEWVCELIRTSKWPHRSEESPAATSSANEVNDTEEITRLLNFFSDDSKKRSQEGSDSEDDMWPTDEESSEEEEDDDLSEEEESVVEKKQEGKDSAKPDEIQEQTS